MAYEHNTTIGSGTLLFTTQILPPDERGQVTGALGQRRGTNVVVINPEDLNSVEAFAVSGITVGTSPVEIIGPETNPLPRCRAIHIENITADRTVYIGDNQNNLVAEGIVLTNPTTLTAAGVDRVKIPLLHNNSIWAQAASNTANLRLLIY